MWRARRQGWEPVALFNMLAAREERSRSHGLAPAVLAAQAQALGLPLVTARADWSDYEVVFIATLRDEARRAEAVVFGDIDLDAHREWEEKVCHAAGLEAVLVAVELVLESGALSAEHILNVVARLTAAPLPVTVENHLPLKDAPLANPARYDRLRVAKERGHA